MGGATRCDAFTTGQTLDSTTSESGCTLAKGKKDQYLDRQTVQCEGKNVLSRFHFTSMGCTNDDFQYEFTCLNADLASSASGADNDVAITLRADTTSCNPIANEYLQYLDRHRIQCED